MTWAAIAPSSAFDETRVEKGLEILHQHGIEVEPLEGVLDPSFYLAAPDGVRLEHLQHALSAPEYEGVWVIRGGGGLTRILDQLDWSRVQRRPLVGFSDVTPLLNAMALRELPAIHGPVLHSLGNTDDTSLEHLFALLSGETLQPLRGETWQEGTATGRVIGGNLTLLAASCGTPYAPDPEGAVFVLEDIGEPAFRLDRALSQLISSGILPRAAGIALGTFEGCRGGEDWTVEELLKERLLSLEIPVIAGLPIGHGPENRAFRVGGPATLFEGALHLH